MMTDLGSRPWEAEADGSIYAATPDGREHVGVMDTKDLAEEACSSHNTALALRRARERALRSGVTRMTGLTGVQIGDGNSQSNVF